MAMTESQPAGTVLAPAALAGQFVTVRAPLAVAVYEYHTSLVIELQAAGTAEFVALVVLKALMPSAAGNAPAHSSLAGAWARGTALRRSAKRAPKTRDWDQRTNRGRAGIERS